MGNEEKLEQLKQKNPWKKVVKHYETSVFLLSDKKEYIYNKDEEFIKEYNKDKETEGFVLNVPIYPWYGNPLTAKVIVLSLNPGYSERESMIARIIQQLPEQLTEGYTEHLRKMLTFDTDYFLPSDDKIYGFSSRDIANLHQNWYWTDRLTKTFIDVEGNDNSIDFEDINKRFAVIEYIAYSSRRKPSDRFLRQTLPSQEYTKQLIQYIIENNKDTVFIVARCKKEWRRLLEDVWKEDRFIILPNAYSRKQYFSKKALGDKNFARVMELLINK